MNKNLNLVEILKNCPKGTKLYSIIYGEVKLNHIENDKYPIVLESMTGYLFRLAQDGRYFCDFDGECTLFPSKEQRDWSNFKPNKPKFDPKTLKPFDKVLCRNGLEIWRCDFFSSYMETYVCPNVCIGGSYMYCIPYNEETKHLLGTAEEAPEFYRYWED